MRNTSVKLVAVVALFTLGILLGSQIASGDIPKPGNCTQFNCKDLQGKFDPSACGAAIPDCLFGGAGGTYWVCDAGDKGCNIIQPYQPQPCNGYCKVDNNISCTVNFNKCR